MITDEQKKEIGKAVIENRLSVEQKMMLETVCKYVGLEETSKKAIIDYFIKKNEIKAKLEKRAKKTGKGYAIYGIEDAFTSGAWFLEEERQKKTMTDKKVEGVARIGYALGILNTDYNAGLIDKEGLYSIQYAIHFIQTTNMGKKENKRYFI